MIFQSLIESIISIMNSWWTDLGLFALLLKLIIEFVLKRNIFSKFCSFIY